MNGIVVRAVKLEYVYEFDSVKEITDDIVLKDFELISIILDFKSPTGYFYRYQRKQKNSDTILRLF